MTTKVTIPGKNVLRYSFLSSLPIAFLSVRNNLSSGVGGGIFSSSQVNKSNGIKKVRPAKNGSQKSGIENCNCKNPVTVLTNPDENIKLTARAAPMKSV